MNKKSLATVIEIIPVIATAAFFTITYSSINGAAVNTINTAAVIAALLGLPFFIIGRILAKESKPVLILGILDILCTVSVIAFYTLAIFLFGQ